VEIPGILKENVLVQGKNGAKLTILTGVGLSWIINLDMSVNMGLEGGGEGFLTPNPTLWIDWVNLQKWFKLRSKFHIRLLSFFQNAAPKGSLRILKLLIKPNR